MKHVWRWFGPNDPVGIREAVHAGARGIVTALHEVPNGEIWSRESIETRQRVIRHAVPDVSIEWLVVESLPVHESIKTRSLDAPRLLDSYKMSLRNLASAGIKVVCYNWMPVLDWTRTDLAHPIRAGALTLRFDVIDLIVFDCHVLKRAGAEAEYTADQLRRASSRFASMTPHQRETLVDTVLAGLPGAEESYSLDSFRYALDGYVEMGASGLRDSLVTFLQEIVPVAEECGIQLAIHPDDPPRPILGLPRIVSTRSDLEFLLGAVDSAANGLTFCTGSLGAERNNDVPGMARDFAQRIRFAHLRNVRSFDDGSFIESGHLEGDVDMISVIEAILVEEGRRREAGRRDADIPIRPDHGIQMLDDLGRSTRPGYAGIGRAYGLAEIRGIEAALRSRIGGSDSRSVN